MTFTLRELADKFGVNLKRVRRWSQGILPPDPRARRQAGLSREYTHNEAFTLLLAGYLVNNLPLLKTCPNLRIAAQIYTGLPWNIFHDVRRTVLRTIRVTGSHRKNRAFALRPHGRRLSLRRPEMCCKHRFVDLFHIRPERPHMLPPIPYR